MNKEDRLRVIVEAGVVAVIPTSGARASLSAFVPHGGFSEDRRGVRRSWIVTCGQDTSSTGKMGRAVGQGGSVRGSHQERPSLNTHWRE